MPLRLRAYSRNPEAGRIATPVMALAGQLMIASTLISIATLHALPNGPLKLLFVLFLVFAADTGAYFAGRRFGRRKLADRKSVVWVKSVSVRVVLGVCRFINKNIT